MKKFMIKIFRRFKKIYKDNYTESTLGHSDLGEPTAEEKEDPEKMRNYEMIIESGFFIYFLISLYMELDSKFIDKEMLNEL